MSRALAVLVGLSVAGNAQAQSWTAGIVLIPEQSSGFFCQEVPQVTWELKLEGGAFSGTNNYGAKFSTPVSPDGSVKASYTGKVGDDTFPMELTGNVNTRQFELHNPRLSCRFKVVAK